MRILLIEDNRDIAENIAQYFEGKKHILDFAEDGLTGLHLASKNTYDVIVLDLMLPGIDGLEVCRRLQEDSHIKTPILMLTARDSLENKLEGFTAGADDYLIKPFALYELEMRLLALHRRAEQVGMKEILKVADLEYNPTTLVISRAGQKITLKPISRKILALLMRQSHRVVSRQEIEYEIWGEDTPDGDVLRAHIYAIRNAIDKPFDVKLLHTIHSTGFRISTPEVLESP
jgi:DNA-binding response OmpR family regulator